MAAKAKDVLGFEQIDVIADKGYFRGQDLLTCRDMGVSALVPKPDTSNARAASRYGKEDFLYLSDQDAYRCPAGQLLTRKQQARPNPRCGRRNRLFDCGLIACGSAR
jgi:transposase